MVSDTMSNGWPFGESTELWQTGPDHEPTARSERAAAQLVRVMWNAGITRGPRR